MGAGTLYRSLHRMLEEGLVVEIDQRPRPGEDDERRRYYRMTPLGRKAARAEAQRLADLVRLARASGLAPKKV
jgi:DNA-binding PadR family transcriptional regulator